MSNNPELAGSLRSALTARLIDQGAIKSRPVADAFRAVPRHLFVPQVSLPVAYADDVVLMKSDDEGIAISTVSQPTVVAMMLEQAEVQPGDRVLEIGSGGYNAALLSELVGPHGRVTTIDIDPDVVERARRTLDDAGYPAVRVLRADGEYGCDESAPYDLILLTVTAADIAPAWRDQLAATGRIVVPLRLRGQTRSVAFGQADGVLRSRSNVICGFVPMQGAGANEERVFPLYEDKVQFTVDEDQVVDPPGDVLGQPRVDAWSGILLDREEPYSDLDLWLASNLPGYGVLSAHRSAIKGGLVSPALRWGSSAVSTEDAFGYLTSRRGPARDLVEVGAIAHGPAGKTLADDLVTLTRTWDRTYRHGPGPSYTVHPASTALAELPPGAHITTRHNTITLHWE